MTAENFMLYVGTSKSAGGHSFRCDSLEGDHECGCNVFHKVPSRDGQVRYACNACGTVYMGERYVDEA